MDRRADIRDVIDSIINGIWKLTRLLGRVRIRVRSDPRFYVWMADKRQGFNRKEIGLCRPDRRSLISFTGGIIIW